jgi:hypothetical protein
MSSIIKQDHMDTIQKQSLPGLDFPPEFILPFYDGQSILNIPASICQAFDVAPLHSVPLTPGIFPQVNDEIQRIIIILMDGLALSRFSSWLDKGEIPVWNHLINAGNIAPITSISPSTTSAAMTTLWTGQSAAEHGVMGYEMWLKQYGIVSNMISQSPMSFKTGHANLSQAGFDAETVLTMPRLGEHLAKNGVATYSFQHYSIANSGLSRTFMNDVNIFPYANEAECWVNLRELIETKKNEKMYLWTYWSALDSLGHRYGPDDERTETYFQNFSRNLEHNLINRLTKEQRKGTLLILTSDHGQVTTSKDPYYSLSNHPEFINCLHIKPTGESRLTYLHVKPDKEKTLHEYVEKTWPNQFLLMDSSQLLNAGLFGSGVFHSDIHNRIGDKIMLAKENNFLWWSDEENPLFGRHGGLTANDMIVPFVTISL